MSKQVKLTWRFDDEVITEEVNQLNKRETNAAREESVIPVMTSEGLATIKNTEVDPADLVVFEDEEGVFALPKEQIIIVQDVEKAS